MACQSSVPGFDFQAQLREGITLHWAPNVEEDWVRMRLVHEGSSGWVSIGPNDSPNMVGTDAVIGTVGGGALEYDITGRSLRFVTPRDVQSLSNNTVLYEGGSLTVDFTRPLSASSPSSVAIAPDASTVFVWAADTSEILENVHHLYQGTISLNPSVGCPSLVFSFDYLGVHGLLMAVAWVILVPLGIFIATYLRTWEEWVNWHRGAQLSAMLLALLSVALAAVGVNEQLGGNHLANTHAKLGVAVTALGWLQLVNGMARPKKGSQGDGKTKLRSSWEILHRVIAALLVPLSWYNCFEGEAEAGALGDTCDFNSARS